MSEAETLSTFRRVEATVRQISGFKGEITPASDIRRDIGLDSLEIVDMAMDLEDDFAIDLSDDEVERPGTVGELVALIEARIAAR